MTDTFSGGFGHGTGATLVVGVDFSDANKPALEAAIQAGLEMKARLALVHALTPLAAPGLEPARPEVQPVENESADILVSDQARAQRWQQRVRDAGVSCAVIARAGPPATVLVEEAQRLGAEAIVVGTHGRTGLSKLFMGSVAERVVKASHVPVLVVPQETGAMQHVVFPSSPTLT